MSPGLLPLLAAAGLTVLVWVLGGGVRGWLQRRDIVDRPNARSSHTRPVPRGAGLVVIPVAAAAWGLGAAATDGQPAQYGMAALALALCALSFRDDMRPLPVWLRLGAQALAVAVGLALLDADARVAQGWLPVWADRLLAGLAWLWFVNLYNFMDGIDGIAGVETLVVSLGLVAVALLVGAPPAAWWPALALAGAAAGFLAWNWPPARLFLGDSGSVPLGYLLGWLLLSAAAAGHWAAALILPAYYWTDATLTLLKRLFRGAKIWQAHREHAYQHAVQAGRSAAWVSGQVAAGGAGLIACALLAEAGAPGPALLAAGLLAGALVWRLARV